jgi:hypothetical protein
MKTEQIVATTHVDLNNDRLTLGALEQVVDAINNGSRPIAGIEHDSTIPPVGKTVEARLEPMSDGEYALVVVSESFENPKPINLPDGTPALLDEIETDNHPFTNKYEDYPEGYVIGFDRVNFQSKSALRKFFSDIENESGINIESHEFGRKSFIPEPEVIIKLAEFIVASLLAKKFVEKSSERLADLAVDETIKFYSLVKATIKKSIRYMRPRNWPITYIFVLNTTPIIEFAAKSNDANHVISSVQLEVIQAYVDKALELHKEFDAQRIQFLLSPEGIWDFNYLLTNKGTSIGTPASHGRRARRMEVLQQEREARPKNPSRRRPSKKNKRK